MNRYCCTGRFGQHPELFTANSGNVGVDFSLAIDQGPNENPAWIDFVAWGRTAEIICEWFRKGEGIEIEGRLTVDAWQDHHTGTARKKVKVMVDRIGFPPGKAVGGDRQPQHQRRPSPSGGHRAHSPNRPGSRPSSRPQQQTTDDELSYEDIPF